MADADKDFLLGYVAHRYSAHRGYYAGILITNSRGVPREFRHTEAVKPTKTQITLYGDSLEASLGSDALGPALYSLLQMRPDILLVDNENLALFGSFLNSHPPAALLVALSDPDLAFRYGLSLDGNLLDARDYALKGSTSERVYAYIEEGGGAAVGTRALEVAQARTNLLSPFTRIRQVLSEIEHVETGRAAK